jgi:uncharacterized repeat protein (TIGR01451 family)
MLPSGLDFSEVTGAISGASKTILPTTVFTISGSNMQGKVSVTLSLTVNDIAPNFGYADPIAVYVIGDTIVPKTPFNDGGTILQYNVVPNLPEGLTIDSTSGVITGKPSAIMATSDFTITGTNSGGHSAVRISIAVLDAKPRLSPYRQSSVVFIKGLSIEFAPPTNDGGEVDQWSVSPSLPAGLSVDPVTGAIEGASLELSNAFEYNVTAENQAGSSIATLRIAVVDVRVTNLSYGATTFTFQRTVPVIDIMPSADGGAVTLFAIQPSLPYGLRIDPITGVLSGTPSNINDPTNYTIEAANSGGLASTVLLIEVVDAPPSNGGYSSNPVRYALGTYIDPNAPSNVGGTATAYRISPPLPGGLVLDPTSGVISGTPTAIRDIVTYTITISNSGGDTRVSLSLQVADLPPSDLRYPAEAYEFAQFREIDHIGPNQLEGGVPTLFTTEPLLPVGLTINATGYITGAPLVRLPPRTFVVTAHNSGGSTITTITISVVQGSILFGVPLSTPATVRNELQAYFASATSDPSVKVATYDDRTTTAIGALTANLVDVVQIQALQAYLGWRMFDHQPIAVTAGATGATDSVLTALVRRSANLTSFDQLKGKRSCNGGFLSAGLYAPISWGLRNGVFEMPAVLQDESFTSCSSPLRNLTQHFFSGTCAPPDEVGQVGVCDLCPGGFESDCDNTNKYAGDQGALRGLSDGVCDVAFIKKGTWHNYCSGMNAEAAFFPHLEAQQGGPPSWCVPFEELSYLEPLGPGKGFGHVPNDVFMIRDGTLTPEQSHTFLDALVHVKEPTIFGIGVDSVRAVNNLDGGAARSYFSNDFETILSGVPGLEASLACVKKGGPCTFADLAPAEKCVNAPSLGLRRENPIKFGFHPRLTLLERDRLDNYFATVRQVTGISVIGVPTASPGQALTTATADVVFMHSGEALLSHMEHGHVFVALEGTRDNVTLAPQRSIALVRQDALVSTFSDLRGY